MAATMHICEILRFSKSRLEKGACELLTPTGLRNPFRIVINAAVRFVGSLPSDITPGISQDFPFNQKIFHLFSHSQMSLVVSSPVCSFKGFVSCCRAPIGASRCVTLLTSTQSLPSGWNGAELNLSNKLF
jgi:hypothetical protein